MCTCVFWKTKLLCHQAKLESGDWEENLTRRQRAEGGFEAEHIETSCKSAATMLRQQPNVHQELIASLMRHASPPPAKAASAEDLDALAVTP